MRATSSRFALALLALFAVRVSAQTEPPSAVPASPVTSPAEGNATAPAPAAAPSAESQDSADAKLAVVLRSYTLLQNENEQLKTAQEKWTEEKASLEAQLNVAKNAIPLADQAAALHEQLRQTQDQLAALAAENRQLKTKLALGTGSSGSTMPSPTYPGTPAAAAATAPVTPPAAAAPAQRKHVIAEGDTLAKISRQYYGTPNRWPEIMAANRDVLRDEKILVVGRTLIIP